MALSKADVNNINVTAVASKAIKFNSGADGFETGNLGGSMVLIKTVTESNVSNITFIHGSSDVVFDSTYSFYVIKLINCKPASGANLKWNTTTDGSNFNVVVTNTTFVAEHSENNSSVARLAYSTGYDDAQAADPYLAIINKGGYNTGADASGSGEIKIFNPSSTTFVKHYMSRINGMSEYPGSSDCYTAGYFNTTSALTGFRIEALAQNITGTVKLYGIT